MSNLLLALLLSGSLAGYIFYRLNNKSLERTGPNLIAAAIIMVFAFIVIFSVANRFIH